MTEPSINPYKSPAVKNDAKGSTVANQRHGSGRPIVAGVGAIVGAVSCLILSPITPQILPVIVACVAFGSFVGASAAKHISLVLWPARDRFSEELSSLPDDASPKNRDRPMLFLGFAIVGGLIGSFLMFPLFRSPSDPSGHFFGFIICAIAGVCVGVVYRLVRPA